MYILGIRWGIGFIIASVLAFCYYVIAVLPTSIEIALTLPPTVHYTVVYETIIVLFLLGYVITTIIKASKESDLVLKAQNNALLARHAEKEVMLKEIHHRVENNMQVIISLMRVKMFDLDDESAKEQYQDTINRVMAMAKIHEKMYQSEDLNKINLDNYFKELSTELLRTYSTSKEVMLNYDIQIGNLACDFIVPMALIFNELFSNSIEHAFTEIENPEIKMVIYSSESGVSFLNSDNGKWKEFREGNSLGTELIDALTKQLGGN